MEPLNTGHLLPRSWSAVLAHNSTGLLGFNPWHVAGGGSQEPPFSRRAPSPSHWRDLAWGLCPSRDTRHWYTHYPEVQRKGLLRYKLILLNYYFTLLLLHILDGQCILEILIPLHKYLLHWRLIIFIQLLTFSYRLFLPQLLKQGEPGGTTFVF